MKIVVLGSHCTGKTTLAKKIYNFLKDEYEKKIKIRDSSVADESVLSKLLGNKLKWRYLPEAPLQILMKGFEINEKTGLEAQWLIIAKQLEMELTTPEPFVADKCLIDILAYTRYLFPKEKTFLSAAEQVVRRNINYDFVIYLPIGEFPIADDGFRSPDPVFQKEIDREIIQAMSDFGVKYHKVSGSIASRLNKVKEIFRTNNFLI